MSCWRCWRTPKRDEQMNVRRREMLSAAHWLMQVFVLPLLCGFVAACLRIAARGRRYCFAFCRLVAAFAARPCDAGAGCSDLVAASGGQGGIGGLRVPPTPSLYSLLTPLYRRRSAEGLEAAWRDVLMLRSALLQMIIMLFCVLLLFCGFWDSILAPLLPEQAATGCLLSRKRRMNVVIQYAGQ